MPEPTEIVHSLYNDFFERGIRYFFPQATLEALGQKGEVAPTLSFHHRTDGGLDLEWMGSQYNFHQHGSPCTEGQLRLMGAIGAVLSARYRSIFFAASAASTARLFEGLAEDRYVSAYLDHKRYLDETTVPEARDIVADVIGALRESSLLTHENRRISTGVILQRAAPGPVEPCPCVALPYDSSLVSIKSIHRLCDGLDTIFLVNPQGMLTELVDVRQFAKECSAAPLPAPSAALYEPHCRLTLNGRHICLVLTPNGEIKIFSWGAQVFHFMEGRWHLTDAAEKYREFQRSVGDPPLAERLFTAALNLAELRRGALFVIMDEPSAGADLILAEDMVENDQATTSNKARIHYLLRGKRILDLETSVLQSIARVDGAITMDREGRLIAFGAILRNSGECVTAQEGGRTTAAVHASRFGQALKVSEDGMVAYYRHGRKCWEV